METKKYLYAAVGAPIVVARGAQERLDQLKSKMTSNAQASWKEAQAQLDAWASEGEKVMSRLADTKTIDELTSKVDFDQMQEQVSKLRDQLEDLLDTWRANFRPKADQPTGKTTSPAGKEATAAQASQDAAQPAEKKTDQKPKPTARSAAGKAASAKTSTAKPRQSTKASTAKKTPAKTASSTKPQGSKTQKSQDSSESKSKAS